MNPWRPIFAALALVVINAHASTWPNPTNLGCDDAMPFFSLEDFQSGSRNAVRGHFFTLSDFDSSGNSTDPTSGGSVVTDSVFTDGYLLMDAKLNRKVGATYHPKAGWAAIARDFQGDSAQDEYDLLAFQFGLADLGINVERIPTITFKVQLEGIDDTAVHQVELPTAVLRAAKMSGKFACIRPNDLAQPDRVDPSQRVPFTPAKISKIRKFLWEARIADSGLSEIDTATAKLALYDVRLIAGGPLPPDEPVVSVLPTRDSKPSVVYANSTIRLDGFAGATRFEIRDLGGKVVASFGAASHLQVNLPRGTYLLSAIGARARSTTKLSVLDR